MIRMKILNIKILDEGLRGRYTSDAVSVGQKYLGPNPDSGFDVYSKEDVVVEPWNVSFIKTGIAASSVFEGRNMPYWLLPRSSISKTPLIMANSVGVIDSGYRGELMCPVRNMSNNVYVVEKGTRLFQIVSNDMVPYGWVNVVESLDDTTRGSGGFGSTGKN